MTPPLTKFAAGVLVRFPSCSSISGFGEYKAALYGPRIFEALEQFRNGARAAPVPGSDAPPRPDKRASGL